MWIRFLIATTAALLITALGHLCIYDMLMLPLSQDYHMLSMSLAIFLWSLTFFGFPLARIVPGFFRRYVEMPMFIWMGSAYILVLLCILTIPLHLAVRVLNVAHAETYLAMCLVGLGAVLILSALRNANSTEDIIETAVTLAKPLSPELEGLKIVLLSDIHVSGLIGKRRMEKLTQKVNALHPDLVLVLGDLVDGTVRQLRKHVLPLKHLKATHGVYYVTGNHEYYCGAERWRRFATEELNWKVLSNAHDIVTLSSPSPASPPSQLVLVGIEDRSWLHQNRKKQDDRLALALQGLDTAVLSRSPTLLLAHQPKDAFNMAHNAHLDLQVSGHTHGGQLWPLKIFVYRDQKYNTGLYQLSASQRLYVSQGTGFWGPPMRLGTRCEISLLRLKGPSSP